MANRYIFGILLFIMMLCRCKGEDVVLSGSLSGKVFIDEGLTILEEGGDAYVGVFAPSDAENDYAIPYVFSMIPEEEFLGEGEYLFENVAAGDYVVKGLLDRDKSSEELDNPWAPTHGDIVGRYEYTATVEASKETSNIEVILSEVIWDEAYDFDGTYVYYGVDTFDTCDNRFDEREGILNIVQNNIDISRIGDDGISLSGTIDYTFEYEMTGYSTGEEVIEYNSYGAFFNDYVFREERYETSTDCERILMMVGVDTESPEPLYTEFWGLYYITEIEYIDTCDNMLNSYSDTYTFTPYYNWAMEISDTIGSHYFGVLKNNGLNIEGIGFHRDNDGNYYPMSFMGYFSSFESGGEILKSTEITMWIYHSACWKAVNVRGWGYFGE